jgi:hypothetical protein
MIPQINKNNSAVIAYRVNPSREPYSLPDVQLSRFPAIVRSVPVHVSSVQKKSPKNKVFEGRD